MPPDTSTNSFASLMPAPPEGGTRGNIHDGFSSDHWLHCAIEATGDAGVALLGSSFWDFEEYFPQMREALKREAERQGHLWMDTSDEILNDLLTSWRFNIVRACENLTEFTKDG